MHPGKGELAPGDSWREEGTGSVGDGSGKESGQDVHVPGKGGREGVTTVLPVGELEAAAAVAVYLTDVGPTEQAPGHQRSGNKYTAHHKLPAYSTPCMQSTWDDGGGLE